MFFRDPEISILFSTRGVVDFPEPRPSWLEPICGQTMTTRARRFQSFCSTQRCLAWARKTQMRPRGGQHHHQRANPSPLPFCVSVPAPRRRNFLSGRSSLGSPFLDTCIEELCASYGAALERNEKQAESI